MKLKEVKVRKIQQEETYFLSLNLISKNNDTVTVFIDQPDMLDILQNGLDQLVVMLEEADDLNLKMA
jgi:hypothetical protein